MGQAPINEKKGTALQNGKSVHLVTNMLNKPLAECAGILVEQNKASNEPEQTSTKEILSELDTL